MAEIFDLPNGEGRSGLYDWWNHDGKAASVGELRIQDRIVFL